MKLIIEMPDKGPWDLGYTNTEIARMMWDAIPLDDTLDKIKVKIKEYYCNNHYMGERYCEDVLKIIDKYR